MTTGRRKIYPGLVSLITSVAVVRQSPLQIDDADDYTIVVGPEVLKNKTKQMHLKFSAATVHIGHV